MKHRGNIILMVLFILISASAFALLMMQYTQSMFDHTRMTYDYNKAYYLAKAGLELGLADSLDSGDEYNLSYAIGYEKEFTDSALLGCGDAGEDKDLMPNCALTGTIIARDTYHTDTAESYSECTADNAFHLSGGDSLAFPLFVLTDTKGISHTSYTTTQFTLSVPQGARQPDLAIGITKKDTNEGFMTSVKPLGSSPTFRLSTLFSEQTPTGQYGEYLVLINSSQGSVVSFCLKSDKPLPRQWIRVEGEGKANNYQVSLSAAKKVTLPGFLFSTSAGKH